MALSSTERGRRWRAANTEWCREYHQKYRDENREKVRAAIERHHARNPGRKSELNRIWREDNRARKAANDRRYREQNREHERERQRNKESRRRAQKRVTQVEAVAALVVLELHDGVCGICDQDVDPFNFHVDHRVPLCKGGAHTYANCQPAHPQCNLSKGGR